MSYTKEGGSWYDRTPQAPTHQLSPQDKRGLELITNLTDAMAAESPEDRAKRYAGANEALRNPQRLKLDGRKLAEPEPARQDSEPRVDRKG